MPTTSNFGWTTPADTDLVKDGALAIRTLGNGIDTSMAQLKGGTTGQVLSKTSNTDMAFTWVTQDDANAIQNAIVDAKGDLIAATANDTPARLAVGNNGETLVADSSATTGLRWQGNFAAGKNKVINGAFDIWQRGTSFSLSVGDTFTADRYRIGVNGTTIGTNSCSRQTFTPGAAPVAGYEGQYFLRVENTSAGSGMTYFASDNCWIEDVRNFAGQTVTLSFWAKSNASRTMAMDFYQIFGSGGSSAVQTSITSANLTTSWTRFAVTFTVPSVSGKTIGTGSCSFVRMYHPQNATFQFDIWGLQLEAGNTATAFQTATGTLAGELAACQRYYYLNASSNAKPVANGTYVSSSNFGAIIKFPVNMRTAPTLVVTSGTNYYQIFGYNNAYDGVNSFTLEIANETCAWIKNNTEAVAGANGAGGIIYTDNVSSSIAFNSEL